MLLVLGGASLVAVDQCFSWLQDGLGQDRSLSYLPSDDDDDDSEW